MKTRERKFWGVTRALRKHLAKVEARPPSIRRSAELAFWRLMVRLDDWANKRIEADRIWNEE